MSLNIPKSFGSNFWGAAQFLDRDFFYEDWACQPGGMFCQAGLEDGLCLKIADFGVV